MAGSPLTDEQMEAMLDRLIRLTQKKRLAWALLGQYTFQAAAGQITYRIRSIDDDGYAPFALDVFRADDVEAIVTLSTYDANPVNSHNLEELFSVAERRVRNWDGLAEEIFDSLDEIDDQQRPLT